jgi:hypothetical protein
VGVKSLGRGAAEKETIGFGIASAATSTEFINGG